VTALAVLLSAAPARSQTTTAQQPLKKPVPAPAPQKPAVAQNNLFNPFGAASNSAGHPASSLSPQTQKFLNPTGNAAAGNNGAGAKNPLASLFHPTNAASPATPAANNNQRLTGTGPQVPAKSFPGYPAPHGSKEMQGHNGSIIRTASDGSVMDVRNPSKGLVIHHAIDGSRRVMVQTPDRSRAYIPARGIPYVQHPYTFRGQQLDSRTLVVNGQLYHQVYRPYSYGGTNLDVYATSRYYSPSFYQWVSTRSNAPTNFIWPYNIATPWYGHYQGYFKPDSAYSSPAQWLTDYLLAATLFVAYTTKGQASDPPATNAAAVSPQVKQALTDEITNQVKQEAAEAADNARNKDLQPGAGSVVQELSDHQSHAYLVSSDLDLVDPSGRRCALSEGDVVQVTSGPKADSGTVDAVVLSSKGAQECGSAAQVQIALNDVQEMQNHMRSLIDQGMASSPKAITSQPVTPAFAAAAPAADQNATKEIEQQAEIAAAADG
jgi:hypothetical protein